MGYFADLWIREKQWGLEHCKWHCMCKGHFLSRPVLLCDFEYRSPSETVYQQEPGWQIQFLTDAGQTRCFWVPAYRALICSLALNNEYCFYATSIVNVLQMSYSRNAKIDCTCTGGTERETKKDNGSFGECISFLPHCCDKTLDRNNLWKEGFILVHTSRVGLYRGKVGAAGIWGTGHIGSVVSKQRSVNAYADLDFSFVSSPDSAHGIGPFRVCKSSHLN